MVTLYAVNATLRQNEPQEAIAKGEHFGRKRIMYDSYTAAGAIAINDVILIGSLLPAGARVLDAHIKFDDLGTVGTLDLGWQASADGGEAADANGLLNAVGVNAAAGAQSMLGDQPTVPGLFKQFSEPVQIAVTASAATNAAGSFYVVVEYVLT